MSFSDIELEIRLLNPQKATTHKSIPPKILKSSYEVRVNVLHWLFNEKITNGVFPDNLKRADVKPVFKIDDPFDKKNTDLWAFYRLYLKFMKTDAKTKKIII